MITSIHKSHNTLSYRILSAFIAFTFIFSLVLPPGYAQLIPASPAGGPQTILNLPAPGVMVTPSAAFTPTLIKGLTIHPENPLEFDFIVEKGDNPPRGEEFNKESMKLVKYFLASLTVPEDQMWVNLSPHEKDRIISENLGATEMGKDMLAQDYILKQLTASLMYPENELGKKFWDRIYKKAYEQYGTTEIPMDTFNKVWIMPDKAVVYEHEGSVFVVESHLKVMLESDYAAMTDSRKSSVVSRKQESLTTYDLPLTTQIIKEVILPEIEKEVNAGETFANLRQIYNSMILATWYKKNLRESLLGQVYVDKGKTRGVDLKDPGVNQKIYEQYLEAFKKGVYNYIKEDYDPATKEIVPRKYFSGGAVGLKESGLTTLYSLPAPQQRAIIDTFKDIGNTPGARFSNLKIKLYEIAQASKISEDAMTEIVQGIENVGADEAQELFVGKTSASSPVKRAEEIKGLLAEIDKELVHPGTGNLPEVAVMSDFHGGLNRFIMLLSDVLNKFSGFQGQLDPNRTIEEQLAAQGLSFKDIEGQIILGGDILDRGKHGIKIFRLIKELVEKGEGKIVSVTGNHDFWAFANLLGMHLPWYKGFHFYGDTEAEKLIAKYRQTNPELFDSPESVVWWTERLAEHNADQDAYQKKAFDGKVKEVRNRFIEDYKTFQKNWTDPQKDAMEKFIGYFARIGVTDPYVGLNGLGKTSALWWKQVLKQINQGYEARRSLGAEDAELSVWQEAIALAEKISRDVDQRLDQALRDGKWWYRVFESINTHAYRSVEWSAKDWSSHKGWGDSVIAEINEMIAAGLIHEEKLTQKNYIQSPTLQALARFYRKNFNLYAFTPYGDLFSHGGLPVNSDGTITIFYNGVTYKGRDIFQGLDAVSNEVKDAGKSLKEIWEALHLVNTWYADMTTELKPNYIKRNIDQIGIPKINQGMGVRHHVTGHNPIALGKLAGRPFMTGDSGYTHAFADFGMSEKYGGQGGWVRMGVGGIKLRGFESETSDVLIENPRTHVWDKETGHIKKTIENLGLEARPFLIGAREQLGEELTRLAASSPVEEKRLAYEIVQKRYPFRMPHDRLATNQSRLHDDNNYRSRLYSKDYEFLYERLEGYINGDSGYLLAQNAFREMAKSMNIGDETIPKENLEILLSFSRRLRPPLKVLFDEVIGRDKIIERLEKFSPRDARNVIADEDKAPVTHTSLREYFGMIDDKRGINLIDKVLEAHRGSPYLSSSASSPVVNIPIALGGTEHSVPFPVETATAENLASATALTREIEAVDTYFKNGLFAPLLPQEGGALDSFFIGKILEEHPGTDAANAAEAILRFNAKVFAALTYLLREGRIKNYAGEVYAVTGWDRVSVLELGGGTMNNENIRGVFSGAMKNELSKLMPNEEFDLLFLKSSEEAGIIGATLFVPKEQRMGKVVLGVDVGGSSVKIGAVQYDENGDFKGMAGDFVRIKPDSGRGIAAYYAFIKEQIDQFREKLKNEDVSLYAGVGHPGKKGKDGKIAPGTNRNIDAYKGQFDAINPEDYLGENIVWGNDGLAQALGGYQTSGRMIRDAQILYLGQGTGLGVALIETDENGKIKRYSNDHIQHDPALGEALQYSSPVAESHQLSVISHQLKTDDRRLTTNPGGIDLNSALLDLQIKRDGNGVPLPLPMQPIQDMHIEGFLPVIINVTPITNLPLLLGIADDDLPTNSADSGSQLMELGFAFKEN